MSDGDVDSKQDRRLQSILDTREAVRDAKNRALDMQHTGQIGQLDAQKIVREAVKDYISELQWLIAEQLPDELDVQDREREWSEVEQTTVEVAYEVDLSVPMHGSDDVAIHGVLEYLDAPDTFTDVWTEMDDSGIGSPDPVEQRATRGFPMSVSLDAWRAANRFWAEIGMDYDLPDPDPPTVKIDSQLMDDVEEVIPQLIENNQQPVTDGGVSADSNLGPVGQWMYDDEFRNSKFFGELLTRLVSGRDMNIIITAASETGVGKTTLAVAIAMMIDIHGWTADKAAVASAAEYDRLYDTVPPGSCLILDEAEKAADARRGMTKESVSLTQSFATKRYRQVFSILTAPSKSWVDNRLGSDAADYWIQALETDMGRIKGESRVYRLKTNEHYESDYVDQTEYIHWPNLDGVSQFDKLDRQKREALENDNDGGYVEEAKVEELKQQATDDARRQWRADVVKRMYDETDLRQKDIADVFDMSVGWVNDQLSR